MTSLVRQIFAKYLEVQSSHKVAKWLNSCGHRQKAFTSRRKGDSGGREFLVQNVVHLLTNRMYLGEIEHKGKQYEGQHDALIDADTFDRTQTILESHRVRPSGALEHTIYEYQLTGLLRCECGYALTTSCSNGQGGRYHYYRCVGVSKRSGHECPVKQVKAPIVDEAVLDIVRDSARSPEFLEAAVAEANRVARAALSPVQARVQGLKKEFAEAERTGSELLKQILLTGVGASAMAQKLLQDSEQRQAQLKGALAEAEAELAERTTEQLDVGIILRALQSFDAAYHALSVLERREFLQVMVREVVVHTDYLVVELYEGRQATRLMAGLGKGSKRGGGEQKNNGREGKGAGGPKSSSTPTLASVADPSQFPEGECVTEFNWLPAPKASRTSGGVGALAYRLPVDRTGLRAVQRKIMLAQPIPRAKLVGKNVIPLALAWREMLGTPGINNKAELAAVLGVSRARVTQVLSVLEIPTPVLQRLSQLEGSGFVLTERTWRQLKQLPPDEIERSLVRLARRSEA